MHNCTLQMRPVVPMPMSASEKATVGRQKLARESFMLSYEAPWPLSIVAPDAALAQYQMAFRHLFELNWVERELSKVCGLYHTTAALANVQRRARRRDSLAAAGPAAAAAAAMAASTSPAAATLAVAYHTAQIMTHFFRQYLLYATFEVLEPLWASLERHIESAATVDDIIDYHRVFLKKVMKGLLLSRNVVVLRALLALKDLALTFVKHSSTHLTIDYEGIDQEMSEAAAVAGTKGPAVQRDRRKNKGQRIRAFLEEALSSPSFAGPVREYRSKFEARCGDFMCALADAHKQARSEKSDTREELESLQSLMGRLDFNGYFAKRVAGVGAAMDGAGGGLVT